LVTLKHAFDANSMKGLVLKILRGVYPPIPSNYSNGLREVVSEMLNRDPNLRPSIKKILEKDFLSARISNLLSLTVAKHEFGNSYMKKAPSLNVELPPVSSKDNTNIKYKSNEEIDKYKQKNSKVTDNQSYSQMQKEYWNKLKNNEDKKIMADLEQKHVQVNLHDVERKYQNVSDSQMK
jgi:NIMA (never in mitosis gene a)-related kinase